MTRMNKEQLKRSLYVAGLVVLALTAHVESAAARTVMAISGAPPEGFQSVAFKASPTTGGVTQVGGDMAMNWWIPLDLDTFGSKTITVRGRAQANGSIACFAFATNTSGAIVTSTAFVSFPSNGAYTSISLSFPNIPTNAAAVVACNVSTDETAELVNVQYTP